MGEPQRDFGFWAGWGLSFSIAGFFFVYIVSQEPTIYGHFCAATEQNCGRSWISALGAWVAIPVAATTFLTLIKQVRVMEAQYREAQEDRKEFRMTVARRAANRARAILIKISETAILNHIYDRMHFKDEFYRIIKEICTSLDHSDLNEFDTMFNSTHSSKVASSLLMRVSSDINYHFNSSDGEINNYLMKRLESELNNVTLYCTDVVETVKILERKLHP